MRTVLRILFVLLVSINVSFGLNANDSLKSQEAIVQYAVDKILLQDEQNRINEEKGRSTENNYVIDIDTEHWIEEKGTAKNKILSEDDFARMTQSLQEFNNRPDGLRFYVVIVNDYVVKFKTRIDPSLVTESFKWNDLKDYPNQQKVVKEIWTKTSTLINGISKALEEKGFPERMIYFYSQLKVEEYDNTSHQYKYDRLSFIGKAIEPLQDAIRSQVKVPAYGAVTNIERAINSIINGTKAVLENKVEAPAIDCSQSIDKIADNTKAIRGEEYDLQVAAFASLLDNPTSEQQKGSRYMIVDQPDNFGNDNVFLQEILPDKVSMLAQSDNSAYRLYIVFKEIKFVMPGSDWEAFAKSVAEKSAVAKQSNTIVMVVPYFKTVCTNGTNWLGMPVSAGTGITMAAVYTSSNLNGSMNAALGASSTSWAKTFDDAYSKIPKKYKTYDYKFLWNGDLINDGFTDHGTITGKASIVELRILEDARFDELQAASKDYAISAASYGGSPAMGAMVMSSQQLDQITAEAERYNKKVDEILSKAPEFSYVTKTNLIESKLSQTVANDFTFWYAKHKKWGVAAFFSSPEDKIFYGGKNPQNVEDGLLLIDLASGITSFVGLDFIFDGLGAYYAYSNGEYTQAAFYVAAASVPFWSSAVRRAVMEGGTYVLKTLKGSYVTVPRGVLGMNNFIRIEEGFSSFIKEAFDLKTLNTVAKYKKDAKFLQTLEEGMVADISTIDRLRKNPELIDEFNAFYKEGKGNLKTFLEQTEKSIPGVYSTTIEWSIYKKIDARPFGNGYWGKRIPQPDPRVDAFELKINRNNESYYLPKPDGELVQFENIVADALQDGKLIQKQKSIYHVIDVPYGKKKILEEAKRQLEAANHNNLKVEWLVSDQKAVDQLTSFFNDENVNILVKYYPE